ncbi:TnsA-like heteromeric transposase endonuclease subunit [Streptomyces sp. NPDC059766]|uniref:TnsA-like heteromeric transposase endonuclease subunit n=1 Tax=Streptomyces sp. NPDC059766 TaxID=3346940 RepID=UPI003668151D
MRDIDLVGVRYVGREGTERLVRLEEAAEVPFEDSRMARVIPSYVGQVHMPGRYWAAPMGDFVEYESVLESKWLTLLGFDREVTAFSSQPLEFDGIDGRGARRHTPDVFTRRRDGDALLLDMKNPQMRDDPQVRLQEERTRRLCARPGWDYAMVSEPDEQRCPDTDPALHRRWHGHQGALWFWNDPLLSAALTKIVTAGGLSSDATRELADTASCSETGPQRHGADATIPVAGNRFGDPCRETACTTWIPPARPA